MKLFRWMALGGLGAGAALAATFSISAERATPIPPPAMEASTSNASSETIVLAGGCFWGVQGVFQHMKGVTRAVSGYAGGTKADPSYEQVSSGWTGHAESVEVTYDPRIVGLGAILQVYFSVAHDPTELNRQGPDSGTQYRSEIFTTKDAQAKVAQAYIAQLDGAHVFPTKIVTKLEPLKAFYPAEGYHQNYATIHPDQPYIAFNDLPKIANLKRLFPALYQDKPTLVADMN